MSPSTTMTSNNKFVKLSIFSQNLWCLWAFRMNTVTRHLICSKSILMDTSNIRWSTQNKLYQSMRLKFGNHLLKLRKWETSSNKHSRFRILRLMPKQPSWEKQTHSTKLIISFMILILESSLKEIKTINIMK